ncbi:MAG: hypothetical protein NTW61_08210 [Candidatus Melainabacteria bacterium]|nr:hypothetical protein [Candidatus Melainabacteria bacterium]
MGLLVLTIVALGFMAPTLPAMANHEAGHKCECCGDHCQCEPTCTCTK